MLYVGHDADGSLRCAWSVPLPASPRTGTALYGDGVGGCRFEPRPKCDFVPHELRDVQAHRITDKRAVAQGSEILDADPQCGRQLPLGAAVSGSGDVVESPVSEPVKVLFHVSPFLRGEDRSAGRWRFASVG